MKPLKQIPKIKEFNTKEMWELLKKDDSFFCYFPDKFQKQCPGKQYFWQVFQIEKERDFKKLYKKIFDNLKK